MQKISNTKKGFTLVELLIVIGILAVLATTAVIILNPAQLLAQARDSQRFNDLRSIESAIALYMTDVSPIVLGACEGGTGTSGRYNTADAPATPSFTTAANQTNATGDRSIGTSGWVDINFNDISTGSPFSALPIDPTNDAAEDLVYRYACDNSTNDYELNAVLESNRYTPMMADDGGNMDGFYEVGTDLTF